MWPGVYGQVDDVFGYQGEFSLGNGLFTKEELENEKKNWNKFKTQAHLQDPIYSPLSIDHSEEYLPFRKNSKEKEYLGIQYRPNLRFLYTLGLYQLLHNYTIASEWKYFAKTAYANQAFFRCYEHESFVNLKKLVTAILMLFISIHAFAQDGYLLKGTVTSKDDGLPISVKTFTSKLLIRFVRWEMWS